MLLLFLTIALVLPGVIGALFQLLAIRSFALKKSGEATIPHTFPPVSIIKPLKGLDDGLFDNLESFCVQDYPQYEIIFALQNRNDPAYKVINKIKEKYPLTDITIAVEYCNEGLNPKVRNLIPAYGKTKYDLVLISDSNVKARKDYLTEITRHMEDPSVGLVSNMIRGIDSRSFGALMENLHMNSFIVGSVCFLDRYLKMPCVIGKSMLMRKSDIEAIGGFRAVKDFLAEDYIIGQRIHSAGKKVVLSGHVIDNVNEYWGVRRFINRHTRWAKLRWHIGGAKYIFELAGNAVFMSLILLSITRFSKTSLAVAGTVTLLKVINDFYLGVRLRTRLNPLLYSLTPIKDLIVGFIWFVPIFSNTVEWRGQRYIIGKDSVLSPMPEKGIGSFRYRLFGAIKLKRA